MFVSCRNVCSCVEISAASSCVEMFAAVKGCLQPTSV